MRVSGADDPMHANCERNDALKRRRLCRSAAFCTTLVAVLLAASPAFAADRIYWSNLDGNSISWSNLDGSGGGDLQIDPAALNGPMGLAIDSAHGRLYWSNYGLSPAGSGTTSLMRSSAPAVPCPRPLLRSQWPISPSTLPP